MSTSQIIYVDIDKVRPNNYNPNVMDTEKFEALKDFCQTQGAEKLDPIWVRNDGVGNYEIIDGEHRWKAAKEVGWKRLRAFIIDMNVDGAKAFNVRKNRERGKLHPKKMGKILYDEYRNKDMTQNGVGQKFGMSRQLVQDYIGIYENWAEICKKLNIAATAALTFGKARKVLRELKREEKYKGQVETDIKAISEDLTKRFKKALPQYAKEKKKIESDPKLKRQRNLAIVKYFVNLLETGELVCPYCGTNHAMLEWTCCRKPLWEGNRN